MLKHIKILSLVFIAAFLQAVSVFAMDVPAPKPDNTNNKIELEAVTSIQDVDFEKINKDIEQIEEILKNDNADKNDIDDFVSFLTSQDTLIVNYKKEIEKNVKFVQKQLDALGAEPQNGEAEDEAITMQRSELIKEMSSQDRLLKEADLTLLKLEELTNKVLNARNQKIYGDLITKRSAFINPVVFFSGVKAYAIFFWNVTKSPVDWYMSVPESQRSYALLSIASVIFVLIIALTLAIILRRFILNNWGYKAEIVNPTFNRKVIAAIAVAIARGLIFAFLIIGCIIWMVSTKIFEGSLLETVLMCISFCTLMAIGEATASRVTFAPYYPQWRLVNVSTEKAAKFTKMLFTYIVFNLFTLAQMYIAQEAKYSLETIHFTMILSCAVTAFSLMWFAKIAFDSPKEKTDNDADSEENALQGEDEIILNHGMKMILGTDLFCSVTFAASLFGYPELSLFILRHIVLSLIMCGIFEVFRRSLIDIIKKLIILSPLMKKYKSSKKVVAKIDFWLRAVINPTLLLIAIFSLLNLWGLPGDFMLQAATRLLFGFKIGGIQISLIAVALGIVVFFGSLTVMRIVKSKLSDNVLAKIDMDDGIKHSLVSGVSFVGFIISILLAIIAMGIDLTNLAFIAGALSVGIGFGLQDVIKNLVSGIIILLERPFRVGDWVIMNGEEGKIKQINIRSTEMETFKRTSVIIPNATLLSSSVTNLTHGDNMARQSIKVGVAYNSDPEKVKQILLDCAKECKDILRYPEPYVLFQDFGASSLDFELRYYIRDLWASWTKPSDLRYLIFKRFAENNIEIPFAQMVIYNGDKANEEREKLNKIN